MHFGRSARGVVEMSNYDDFEISSFSSLTSLEDDETITGIPAPVVTQSETRPAPHRAIEDTKEPANRSSRGSSPSPSGHEVVERDGPVAQEDDGIQRCPFCHFVPKGEPITIINTLNYHVYRRHRAAYKAFRSAHPPRPTPPRASSQTQTKTHYHKCSFCGGTTSGVRAKNQLTQHIINNHSYDELLPYEYEMSCNNVPGQYASIFRMMLERASVDSRLLAHSRNFAAEGWILREDEKSRAVTVDFLDAGRFAPSRETAEASDETEVTIGALCKSIVRTEDALGIVAKISKDVFDELVKETYGTLCLEEIAAITERMKAFWMESMRDAIGDDDGSRDEDDGDNDADGNNSPGNDRSLAILIDSTIAAIDAHFEAQFDHFWRCSDFEFLPLEEAVTPPWRLAEGDIFLLGLAAATAQSADDLSSKYFRHCKREQVQGFGSLIDIYLSTLAYRLSGMEIDGIRRGIPCFAREVPGPAIAGTGTGTGSQQPSKRKRDDTGDDDGEAGGGGGGGEGA